MISVAIALYNGAKFIEKQLDSIRAQSVPVDEVVLCDDCSKDDTVQLVDAYIKHHRLSGWKLVVRETNLGYCKNFLDAVSRTSGDMVFLCDQDDIWYPDKVKEMALFMEGHPECLALSSRYEVIDQNDTVIPNPGIIHLKEINDGSVEEIIVEQQIGCSFIRGFSSCFRKELKPYLSFVKLDDLLGHDWLIQMRASLLGKNYCLNKILTGYRFHTSNVSLSAIERKELVGDQLKRVRGLEQSVAAHQQILEQKNDYPNLTAENITSIEKQIRFESKRLRFLQKKNIFTWISLFAYIGRYQRYYKTTLGGFKVWLGDLAYAYHK